MKNLKHLKTFEGLNYAENAGLYDKMSDLLARAEKIYHEFTGVNYSLDPQDAIESLEEIPENHNHYTESRNLIDKISDIETQIDEMDAEENYDNE